VSPNGRFNHGAERGFGSDDQTFGIGSIFEHRHLVLAGWGVRSPKTSISGNTIAKLELFSDLAAAASTART